MISLTHTPSNTFRTYYRAVVAILAISVISLLFFTNESSNAAVFPPCANNASGSATIDTTFDSAISGKIWVQIDFGKTIELEAKVNDLQCSEKTRFITMMKDGAVATGQYWQSFNTVFDFKSGKNSITISSFEGTSSLYKIAVSTDGTVPEGDGSNILMITTPTTPTTTTIAPTTTSIVGQTTKAPTDSTTTAPTTTTIAPTTIAPTTTTSIVGQTTKAPTDSTTTTIAGQTTTTAKWNDPTTSTIAPSPSAPTTATGITVLGTNVQATTPTKTASSGSSLPFTGSSSRTLAIWSLSIMLAGLVLLGVQKKYLFKPNA